MSRPRTERRQHPRFPASVRVRLAFTGQEFTAESLNLSAGGVLLDSRRSLPLGTRLQMRIDLPLVTKIPIRVEGEVVRNAAAGARGLAIRFTTIGDEDRALLGELARHGGLDEA